MKLLPSLLSLVAFATAKVIDLNANNFQQLTQIGQGMTTGDWFVEFYAPWCGHCKRLAPVWEEVGQQLEGEINVARVDATQEKELASRFSVRGYPTLYFFHGDIQYKFGGERNAEKLVEFARGGYKEHNGKKAQAPLTVGDKVHRMLRNLVSEVMNVWKTHPLAGAALFLSGLMLGLVVGLSLMALAIRSVRAKARTVKPKQN